jgi:outer membrane protein OmpA-like peptidoglycan-associated protein
MIVYPAIVAVSLALAVSDSPKTQNDWSPSGHALEWQRTLERRTSPATIRCAPSRVPARANQPAAAGVGRVLARAGQPIDHSTRVFLEPRFGRDLGDVQVHTDGEAAASAEALGASAFTLGRHIVFGPGQYQPENEAGRRLIAHELAHVLQARGGTGAAIGSNLRLGGLDDPAEREADHTACAVMAGHGLALRGHDGPSGSSGSATATIRRQPAPPAPASDAAPTAAPAARPLDPVIENADPFMAAALGSTNIDGFPTGSSDLNDAQRKELQETARRINILLKKYPASTVAVIGHTDTVGTETSNMALGQARAESVDSALAGYGVPPNIMTTSSEGEGGHQAVPTKDETPEARNRRVEVRFSPQAGPSLPAPGPIPTPGSAPPFGAPPPVTPLPGVPTLPPTLPGNDLPGPRAPKLPDDFWTRKIPDVPTKQINNLNDAIDAIADAVANDRAVRALRDVAAQAIPFMPTPDAKKALDDAIKTGTKEGIKAGLKAVLQMITGQPGTQMPANPHP